VSTEPPTRNRPDPRLRKFAWLLLGASAFMFVSIIVKTALQGP
jgi:hypothetical protein